MAFLYMSKSTFHVTTSTSLCGERGKFKKEKTGSRKRNPIKQLMYFLLSFQSYHFPGASDLQYDNKMEIVLKTAVVHLAFTLSRSYTLHPHKFNTSETNSVIIPILQMTKPSRQRGPKPRQSRSNTSEFNHGDKSSSYVLPEVNYLP